MIRWTGQAVDAVLQRQHKAVDGVSVFGLQVNRAFDIVDRHHKFVVGQVNAEVVVGVDAQGRALHHRRLGSDTAHRCGRGLDLVVAVGEQAKML